MSLSDQDWKSTSATQRWLEGERKGRGVRILPKEGGYFVHVTSRTRGQAFLLGEVEKRSFLMRLRQWSAFSGIGVLTHCVMSNHFHLLLWVPELSDLSHGEILERLKGVWPQEKWEAWEKLYGKQTPPVQKFMDQKQVERMGNLASFMRVLKQSFSNWYNHREGCRGTFWEGRYRSVVVEDNPLALMSVAAYIDLNPVRAGMVEDPLDAVWSGYGAACGGDAASREGLKCLIECARGVMPASALLARRLHLNTTHSPQQSSEIMRQDSEKRAQTDRWPELQKAYRIWLYAKGNAGEHDSSAHSKNRKGVDPQVVYREFEQNGVVPPARFLRQKWRCYTRGVGIGSPAFLESLLRQYQQCFTPHRTHAGPKLKNKMPGLHVLRQVD
ncbi:hypothetical protein P3T73_02095 [Kiritimatiellota bacterium B12222]|nr:hypothetical protein P3T73_02095 [Kiritimatiellota bacterium B12222]